MQQRPGKRLRTQAGIFRGSTRQGNEAQPREEAGILRTRGTVVKNCDFCVRLRRTKQDAQIPNQTGAKVWYICRKRVTDLRTMVRVTGIMRTKPNGAGKWYKND